MLNLDEMMFIGTHDGKFHSDELAAIALIDLCYGTKMKILRTRDNNLLEKMDLVLDVGGKYQKGWLDHHQRDFTKTHTDGTPYATCGLVWDELKHDLIKKYILEVLESKKSSIPYPSDEIVNTILAKVEEEIITHIDGVDTGVINSYMNSFTKVIATMSFDAGINNNDNYFNKALAYMRTTLDSLIKYITTIIINDDIVLDILRDKDNKQKYKNEGIIVLQEYLPWVSCVVNHLDEMRNLKYKLCIYPPLEDDTNNREYKVQAFPNDAFDRTKLATKAPKHLCGTNNIPFKDLGMKSDAVVTFTHIGGWISGISGTLEDAVMYARYWLHNQQK